MILLLRISGLYKLSFPLKSSKKYTASFLLISKGPYLEIFELGTTKATHIKLLRFKTGKKNPVIFSAWLRKRAKCNYFFTVKKGSIDMPEYIGHYQ